MNFMNKIFPVALIIVIVLINGFRFYDLKNVPAGYHVDEYSAAVTARCFSLEGTNAWGKKPGAFFNLAYGNPRPATYVWPVAFLGKIFGYEVPFLRALSALGIVFGILGIFVLGRHIGGFYSGLWAALAASLSPHIFVMSRVAFESMFAASFFAWGLYFLLKIESKKSMIASVLFMALSLYSYPPARLFIPLFLILFFVVMRGWRHGFKPWVIFVLIVSVLMIPLVYEMMTSGWHGRFNQISIFSQVKDKPLSFLWIKNVSLLFFHNAGLHLTPDFLFRRGDISTVHSTTQHGIFSWLDYTAWGIGALLLFWQWLRKPEDKYFKGYGRIILICIAGFFLSIVPASLTNSEIPNALRISLHWPLVSLLTGILIAQAQLQWRWIFVPALAVSLLFAYFFLGYYFAEYRKLSAGLFHPWIVRDAENIKTNEHWMGFLIKYRMKDYHSRYYLMNQRGKSCMESFEIWNNVYNNMGRGKRY